ncbi:MAG TPA: cytochrome c [Planctomycetes bacterium]|nr:cytochrome c [Planctomycetota bacterium]
MNRFQIKARHLLPALGLAVLGGLLASCTASTGEGSKDANVSQAASAPSGAEIWANTCARCHTFRDPATLNDSQWDVAMMHMRVRAKLHGADARAVLKFLQSSN